MAKVNLARRGNSGTPVAPVAPVTTVEETVSKSELVITAETTDEAILEHATSEVELESLMRQRDVLKQEKMERIVEEAISFSEAKPEEKVEEELNVESIEEIAKSLQQVPAYPSLEALGYTYKIELEKGKEIDLSTLPRVIITPQCIENSKLVSTLAIDDEVYSVETELNPFHNEAIVADLTEKRSFLVCYGLVTYNESIENMEEVLINLTKEGLEHYSKLVKKGTVVVTLDEMSAFVLDGAAKSPKEDLIPTVLSMVLSEKYDSDVTIDDFGFWLTPEGDAIVTLKGQLAYVV